MALEQLTDRKVRSARNDKPYSAKLSDGGGLTLVVAAPNKDGNSTKSWSFRFVWQGKPKEMGLGPYPDITLHAAREAATAVRAMVRADINPIDARRQKRVAVIAKKTFAEVAALCIASREADWKSSKHAKQWAATLATYCGPPFGTKPVADITFNDVHRIIAPLWKIRSETATRVVGRIRAVIDYAVVMGWRADGPSPAAWAGRLAVAVGSRPEANRLEHHAAIPWLKMPAFWSRLVLQPGTAALALQFTILTAGRTTEILDATFGEVDMELAIWTVPPARMKAGKEHNVPLSSAAMSILRPLLPAQEPAASGFLFPGAKAGRPLSNMSLTAVLRRMGLGEFTVHGFRSSFRDWVANTRKEDSEAAERALAHGLKSKTQAAYQRSTLVAGRIPLMNAWADYLTSEMPQTSD